MHPRRLLYPLLLLLTLPTQADTLNGTVVSVADGDTIIVLHANREQNKIRLGGIDAPEKSQPFGQCSKQSMSALAFGKEGDVQWHKPGQSLTHIL